MKQHLTAGRIRDLQLPIGKNQAFLRDTDVTGFAVRVTSGSKSFIFQAKMAGKDIRITIGSVAAWGIEDARAEARRLQILMDKGIDPRQEKIELLEKIEEARVEKQRIETTFGEAWKAYLTAKKSMWSSRHFFDHERAISEKRKPGPLAEFISLKLTEITPDRIKTWLDKNNLTRPTYTAICFRKLRAFLNWASDQNEFVGAVLVDACSKKVATNRVAKNKVKDDCIQREQLKPWFDAVKSLSNPTISSYLQILLLTGARREELASLKWENTDLKWKSITIKDKVEGERTIPLTPYVESLMRELKIRNETPPPKTRILHGKEIPTDPWKPSHWVFSSPTSESGRIVEPRIALNRAVVVAGLPPLTLHGLRRSFGTLAEWTEAPVGVVAQIMGHKPSALAEKHYRRRPIDLLRMWHTKIEKWIVEQAGIDLPELEVLASRNMS